MKLSIKRVNSFFGQCLIITDNETEKSVEIMSAQLTGILRTNKSSGSLPHAEWEQDKNSITITHDEDSEDRTITFTLDELEEVLDNERKSL